MRRGWRSRVPIGHQPASKHLVLGMGQDMRTMLWLPWRKMESAKTLPGKLSTPNLGSYLNGLHPQSLKNVMAA